MLNHSRFIELLPRMLALILLVAHVVGWLGSLAALYLKLRARSLLGALLVVFLAAPWLYRLPMLGTQTGKVALALTLPTVALLALSLALSWAPSFYEIRATETVPGPGS